MRLRTLVLREIFERKSQLLTSFVAILLGITVIVSIQNITYYSKGAVEQEMDSLGANVLVLPKSATLQDYYNADLQSDTIPEEYVTLLSDVGHPGTRQHLAQAVGAHCSSRARTFTSRASCRLTSFRRKSLGAGRESSPIPSAAATGSA